jgi:hypothetical protein
MTEDDKALVDRLRGKAAWLDPEIDMVEEWEASDAADRIEALSAENERLKYDGIHSCHDQCERPLCVLERDNEKLREALRDVLVYAPDFMHGAPKKHYEKIANGNV